MGKKDEYQFDYLDDNNRFADQINGALFQGRQVVKPDELEPAPAQSVYLGKEAGRRENFKAIVDKFGDNPAAMKQAGIAYAAEQIIDLIANGVNGIHVYSMNKPDVALKIKENLSEIL